MSLRSEYLAAGYIPCLEILPAGEAARLYQQYRGYLERYGDSAGRLPGDLRFRAHLVAHWARDIVFHPRLVAAAQELLGTENVICWESDIVSKPAGSQHFFSWHQVGLPEGKVVCSVTRL